jgi:hypothetical protein
MSLGLNLCVYVPRTLEGDDAGSPSTASSTAALVSPVASSSSAATSTDTTPTAAASNGKANGAAAAAAALMPTTPTPTSAGLRLSKSGSKSFKVPPVLPFYLASIRRSAEDCSLPRSIPPA